VTVLRVTLHHDPDDRDCAVPIVSGTVSGRPYQFLLDTGAARSTMACDQYTCSLPEVGEHASHGAFGPIASPVVTVTDLRIGPIQIAELDIVRSDRAGPGTANLLGMHVLRRYRSHFRIDAGEVEIDAGQCDADGDVGFGCEELQTDQAGHPYVDVAWPGVRAYACWDTGAGITVVDRDSGWPTRTCSPRQARRRGLTPRARGRRRHW
jgi:gag-polyprotein putative aspartyl protease